MMNRRILVVLMFATTIALNAAVAEPVEPPSWDERIEMQVRALGDQNAIIIVDAAYPLPTAPGIDVLVVKKSLTKILKFVLGEIEDREHVRAVITTATELDILSEQDAPGIEKYRKSLRKLSRKHQTANMTHESMRKETIELSKTHKVFLIKTKTTIPYSAVLLPLESNYWDAEKEDRLRSPAPETATEE